MSKWEEGYGREYRANFKKNTYDAVNVQFKKDDNDGLTKSRVKERAAEKGMTTAGYIKDLIAEDLGIKK